jgi:hypothetical protein
VTSKATFAISVIAIASCGGGAEHVQRASPPPVLRTTAPPGPAPRCSPSPAVHGELPAADSLIADIEWLASPDRHGRRAGTADERAVDAWVASRFEALCLQPAGDGGSWFQQVSGGSTTTANVLAWLPGTGDDWVMLGAHVDHLGEDAAGYYPGADDNASGVAAMLGVAAALATSGPRPVGVLFVGFGGEEVGLVGSRWLAAHPSRPLDHCRGVINLDMVGRSPFLGAHEYALPKHLAGIGDGPAVGVLDDVPAQRLLALARRACAEAGITMYAAEDFKLIEGKIREAARGRSDDTPFAAVGVPTLFFSTSLQDDYHRRTDTVDKVDATTLRAIAVAVRLTIDSID